MRIVFALIVGCALALCSPPSSAAPSTDLEPTKIQTLVGKWCSGFIVELGGDVTLEISNINFHASSFRGNHTWVDQIDLRGFYPSEMGSKIKKSTSFTMPISGTIVFDSEIKKNVLSYKPTPKLQYVFSLMNETLTGIGAFVEKGSGFVINLAKERCQ